VRCTTGFCAPLQPTLSREVERVGEGRTISSRQQRWLGRWSPPCSRYSPRPLLHHCPLICAHLTTFRCCLPPLLIVKSPWRQEIANADVVHAVCVVHVITNVVSASAFVFLVQDAAALAAVHLSGATVLTTVFKQCRTGFYAPLKPPLSQEGRRAEEGRTTLSC
jgi:hypothetical protein